MYRCGLHVSNYGIKRWREGRNVLEFINSLYKKAEDSVTCRKTQPGQYWFTIDLDK
jgi:hypothetical protein